MKVVFRFDGSEALRARVAGDGSALACPEAGHGRGRSYRLRTSFPCTLPLTPETRGFLDPGKMKRGAILVNTARGGLVNQEVLVECLRSGHLAAAGLDVFSQEPPLPGDPLLSLPTVVCAPHLAWLTRETLERSLAAAAENVKRLQGGAPLLHRVA